MSTTSSLGTFILTMLQCYLHWKSGHGRPFTGSSSFYLEVICIISPHISFFITRHPDAFNFLGFCKVQSYHVSEKQTLLVTSLHVPGRKRGLIFVIKSGSDHHYSHWGAFSGAAAFNGRNKRQLLFGSWESLIWESENSHFLANYFFFL